MARRFAVSAAQYMVSSSPAVTAPPLTMACWFTHASLGTVQELMCVNKASSTGWFILRSFFGTLRGVTSDDAGSLGQAIAASTAITNVWYHGCAVFYDTTNRAVFLNGGSKGTNSASRVVTGITQTDLGRHPTLNNWHDGLMAEAAMWSAALTDAEVQRLAQGVKSTFIRPQSLAAYWPLTTSGTTKELDRNPFAPNRFNLTFGGNPGPPSVVSHPVIASRMPISLTRKFFLPFAAVLTQIYDETMSGGIQTNSSSLPSVLITKETSGGAQSNGTAIYGIEIGITITGGSQSNSSADCVAIINPSISGSIICNGSILISKFSSEIGSGGSQSNGTAAYMLLISKIAEAGGLISGLSIVAIGSGNLVPLRISGSAHLTVQTLGIFCYDSKSNAIGSVRCKPVKAGKRCFLIDKRGAILASITICRQTLGGKIRPR